LFSASELSEKQAKICIGTMYVFVSTGGKFWLLVPFGCRDPREGSLAEDKKGIAG
jgi:hypothetical protein